MQRDTFKKTIDKSKWISKNAQITPRKARKEDNIQGQEQGKGTSQNLKWQNAALNL